MVFCRKVYYFALFSFYKSQIMDYILTTTTPLMLKKLKILYDNQNFYLLQLDPFLWKAENKLSWHSFNMPLKKFDAKSAQFS